MDLAGAVDGLYDAFARYPRRAAMDSCPHCVGKAEQDVLARVPLRGLSCEQLSRYAFKAITTWGAAEDYKHFLPRILELALTREGLGWPGLDLEVIAGKIRLGGGAAWPEEERAALHAFLEAVWRTVLAHDPQDGRWKAEELLPGIASIVDDVAPFLAAWERDQSRAAVLQLADFVETSSHGLRGPWREVAARERVERWLVEAARKDALEAAFERHADEPVAGRLAAAVDAWQAMAARAR